jgi:hypothetical protein
MVPKTGTRLPKLLASLSDARLADIIGRALQSELGASRRAAKTIMSWTGVSDHTARAWLNGRTSPSGVHLIVLAAYSQPVMAALLELTGHDDVALAIDLEALETQLLAMMEAARNLRSRGR